MAAAKRKTSSFERQFKEASEKANHPFKRNTKKGVTQSNGKQKSSFEKQFFEASEKADGLLKKVPKDFAKAYGTIAAIKAVSGVIKSPNSKQQLNNISLPERQFDGIKKSILTRGESLLITEISFLGTTHKTEIKVVDISDIFVAARQLFGSKDTVVVCHAAGKQERIQFSSAEDANNVKNELLELIDEANKKPLWKELFTTPTVAGKPDSGKVSANIETETILGYKEVNTSVEYQKVAMLLKFNNQPLKDKYPSIWSCHCGIEEPRQLHESLIREGFLCESSPEDSLGTLKLTELKEIIAELNIDVKGNKAELIKSISEAASDEFIRSKIHNTVYGISEKGHEFLLKNDDYVKFINSGFGIDITEFEQERCMGKSFYDTMINIYNRHLASEDYSKGDTYKFLALFLDKNDEKSGMKYHILSLRYELSNMQLPDYFKMYEEGFFTKKNIKESLDSGNIIVTTWIDDLQKDKDFYSQDLIDFVYETSLPYELFTREAFTSIVEGIIKGKYDATKLENKVKREYNRVLKEYFEAETAVKGKL